MDLTTSAYYNWGRWVADCPEVIPDCKCAAQLRPEESTFHCRETILLSRAYRRQGYSERDIDAALTAAGGDHEMVTHECAGEGALVIWPPNREEIERICSARLTANRNWYPWETTDQLIAENIAHGLRVP